MTSEGIQSLAGARREVGGQAPSPMRRLVGLLRADRGDLLALGAIAVAIGVLLLATPIAVQALVDFVALGGAVQPLVVVALLLLLGLSVAGLLAALQAWTVELLQRRLFVRMVADLATRLPRVRHSTFDTRYGPDIINRFFDIITVQKTGSFLLLDGLSVLLSVLVGLIVLAFYHPLLLAFDVLLLVAIALIVLGPLRRGRETAVAESKSKYAMVSWFEEIARNSVAFKAGGVEAWVMARSDALAQTYLAKRGAHYRILFRQVLGVLTLQAVASVALLGLGGFLVIRGTLTLGQLVAAELIVALVVSSVAKFGKHLESYYDLMAATDKLGELLDLELERSGDVEGPDGATLDARGARVTLHELGWSHAAGAPLFEGLSVTLEPGETLAIAGPSGSGKSVLLELLWRLRRPTQGSIRVDGVDLRDYEPAAYRSAVSLVGGRNEIVLGSVRDNVTLGRPTLTDAEVRDALEAVGLMKHVSLQPAGLDMALQASGQPLSSHELRCLVIARALAGQPRLLMIQDLLDSTESEDRAKLLDAVFEGARGRSMILVSNAADVHARCDRVIQLQRDPERAVASGVEGAPQ